MLYLNYILCGITLLLTSPLCIKALPTDLPSAASFYVPSLPSIQQDPNHPLKIYAGNLLSDPRARTNPQSTDLFAHLFFVLVKNRRTADRERIVFWFNGGPGCSSFDGLMMEVGPWRMDGKGGFQVKEGGWEEYTTMVFVDQPAGTGFSYTSSDRFVSTPQEAAEQFIVFLGNFYQVFPEYRHMDTYFAGESFAGQWIPYFADAVLESSLDVQLRGAAIGNGWIDPRRQYPTYLDYVVKMGILEENSEPWKEAKKKVDECVEAHSKITEFEPMSVPACAMLILDVAKVREKKVNGTEMCINIYDVRYDDTKPDCGMNWPPDIHPITQYLDRPDVVNALHATDHSGSWIECRGTIHSHFDENKLNASVTILPKVLSKIPVLIFAGDQDLICNYVGLEAMISAMTWNGATGLGTVQTQSWNVNNDRAGTWVESRNLTYAKIFNASHMAPFDSPHITHDMMLRFMGVNFSAIVDGSARIPSSLGDKTKPVFIATNSAQPTGPPISGKTPEQDKAMWEAYYNAGSAALVLVLIFLGIGVFLWCRVRRNGVRLPVNKGDGEEEESIPLTSSVSHHTGQIRDRDVGSGGGDEEEGGVEILDVPYSARRKVKGKGKERALDSYREDDEEGDNEEEKHQQHRRREEPVFDVGDSEDEDESSSALYSGRRDSK
ncbi:hypothetical protein AMATHDRAFT_41047 [Amanita thiersii Skay4041]|uniref:Pheromone-processing carboxypeptidase KEX1 n=1 Tax=Amanita thiersii Skay4041 TaxID=703135 RepID=A0A2A9NPF1_9AGAR|nr:hypothetical protein AMATHDRAFT_41047 [Amanita thiersii Skay4041]